MTLKTSCHCGAVQVEIPQAPDMLPNCNCSICRRHGALCARGSVRIRLLDGADSWKVVG